MGKFDRYKNKNFQLKGSIVLVMFFGIVAIFLFAYIRKWYLSKVNGQRNDEKNEKKDKKENLDKEILNSNTVSSKNSNDYCKSKLDNGNTNSSTNLCSNIDYRSNKIPKEIREYNVRNKIPKEYLKEIKLLNKEIKNKSKN